MRAARRIHAQRREDRRLLLPGQFEFARLLGDVQDIVQALHLLLAPDQRTLVSTPDMHVFQVDGTRGKGRGFRLWVHVIELRARPGHIPAAQNRVEQRARLRQGGDLKLFVQRGSEALVDRHRLAAPAHLCQQSHQTLGRRLVRRVRREQAIQQFSRAGQRLARHAQVGEFEHHRNPRTAQRLAPVQHTLHRDFRGQEIAAIQIGRLF